MVAVENICPTLKLASQFLFSTVKKSILFLLIFIFRKIEKTVSFFVYLWKRKAHYYTLIGCCRCWCPWTLPRWNCARSWFVFTLRKYSSQFIILSLCDSHVYMFVLLSFSSSSGFGGRGVLPGVVTGTNLNSKSSKVKILTRVPSGFNVLRL